MENENVVWPWEWLGDDDDPLDALSMEFDIHGEAVKHLAGKKTGSRYNHRVMLQHGDDLLHVIFSYRNTAERIADYKKTRVILKGEEDHGFDIVEDWDGVKTVHGIHASTKAEYSAASKIADLLDNVTASREQLHAHIV